MKTKHEIICGKDISIGDIIVHNGQRKKVIEVYHCSGVDSIDFGEYIVIKYKNINKNYTNSQIHGFWTY